MTEYKVTLLEPTPKQDEFIHSTAKRKVIRAGRRSGKTTGIGIFAVEQFLQGKRVLYAAPTIEQIGRFWSTVNNALYELVVEGIYHKNESEHFIEKRRTENRLKAKAQPLSAIVYTPDGQKKMGDIKIGDKVLTPFGTITKVTGVFPQGVKDIYEIVFGDGCSTRCTLDHLWEVQRFKNPCVDKNAFKVVTTQDLLNHSKINNSSCQLGDRPRVRLTKPVSFKAKKVILSPYLLGALIGDGKLDDHGSIMFSSVDKHILNQVKSLLPKGMSIKHISRCDYRITFGDKPIRGTNKLRGELKNLELMGKRSHEKFIPDYYKYNSKEVRLKMIQGLFDTDGGVSAVGDVTFSTTSLQLAHDVVEVIQSLGGLCTIKTRQGRYKKDGVYKDTKLYYKLFIYHESAIDLFSLPRKRKRCRLRVMKNANINRSIRTIKYIGREKAQCIMVADKRHLYLTDNFIVTHNTAWNADSLRGDYADVLILDEFQLMSEDAWEVVGAPMMLDTNGDAVFIYTPPSIRSRSASKADDPQHAAKFFKRAQRYEAIRPHRWKTFTFTSMDNPYLSHEALNEITEDMSSISYRMEILAEDIDEAPDALWTRKVIEENRYINSPPRFDKIVVAIDPSASATGDEAGVVTVGKVGDHGFVIADNSVQGLPSVWAIAAIEAYHKHKANYIVAEKNNGGEMIRNVLAQVDNTIKVNLVHASRGKETRAEPVSAIYEKGRGHHIGHFPKLEDELCMWSPDGRHKSPNRLDALVWGFTDLKLVTSTNWVKAMS